MTVAGRLGFVLASHEAPYKRAQSADGTPKTSPFFNTFGSTIRLTPLSPKEAKELVSSAPNPFAESDVEWIVDRGRWPIMLQTLCHARLSALEEGEDGNAWRERGLQEMDQYRHLLDEE
jgi:hypothetical protein